MFEIRWPGHTEWRVRSILQGVLAGTTLSPPLKSISLFVEVCSHAEGPVAVCGDDRIGSPP
jgi:hypothetical protein